MMPVGVRFLIGFVTVVGLTGTAVGQQPANAVPAGKLQSSFPDRATEHKLLAQLVEYLHRDTFPPGDVPEDRDDPPSSGQLKTFLEGRKKMVDNVRVRLRDMKASGELTDLYDGYKQVLAEGDKYADAVRGHELKYFEGIKKLRERLVTDIRIRNLTGTADVLRQNAWVYYDTVGWWRWHRDPWRNRRGLFAGMLLAGANLVAAKLDFHADVLRLVERHKRQVDEYERINLPMLVNTIWSEEARFRSALERVRPAVLDRGRKGIDSLVKEYNWKPLEVSLDPFAVELNSAGGSPFGPLAKLNRDRKITSTKQADEIEQTALGLLDLSEKMPVGKRDDPTKVYNRIKADVAFLAAMHANRAAEYQLGDAGFETAVRVPATGGAAALKAIEAYKRSKVLIDVSKEPLYPVATEKYQEGLALAYSGKKKMAYNAVNGILGADLKAMHDPQFYYDCARIRCLDGPNGIPVAMSYLNTAFMMGYRNAEKARLSTDLELIRSTNKDLFEKAINLYK